MKKLIIAILVGCLTLIGLISQVWAGVVTKDQAMTVANNWITLIILKKGDWGGSESAEVEEVQEFKRGDRSLGYFCGVKPKGFIVVSLRRELAPVKAYSATSNLSPECDEGLADVIKGGMERVLEAIEKQLGPMKSATSQDLERILEISYRDSWKPLERPVPLFEQELKSGEQAINYQEGWVLLSSAWHQFPPYNNQCPDKNCSWPGYGYYNQNARVGCVATAGAQIMRYWNWPPYGEESPYDDDYQWTNMPDRIDIYSPQPEIDAVAELCYEVGKAVGMDYGCNRSGANTDDMQHVYEDHFRYSTACEKRKRESYDQTGWFDLIKTQLNANRPIQYRIPGHSIVADGWQELGGQRLYHINYGWGWTWPPRCDGCNTWYQLDEIYGGNPNDEYMLIRIYPAQAMGWIFYGTYERQSFPYRYFDRDAVSTDAIFLPGQRLQFLPGVRVMCISNWGGSIKFQGSPFFFNLFNTFLYTRGDRSRGIRIYNGTVKLMYKGSIKFY